MTEIYREIGKYAVSLWTNTVIIHFVNLDNFHLLNLNRIIVLFSFLLDFEQVQENSFYRYMMIPYTIHWWPDPTDCKNSSRMFWFMLERQPRILVWESIGLSAHIHLTPTIIKTAKRLYENHYVEDITHHEADKVSIDRTIAYILEVIKTSREKGEKGIYFVTGVPGAGKTLVELNVAVKQSYQDGDKLIEDEGAVYLSGNGPLVAVLTEALTINNHKKCRDRGEKKNMSDSRR